MNKINNTVAALGSAPAAPGLDEASRQKAVGAYWGGYISGQKI